MPHAKMTSLERRSVSTLAAILSLRMTGLFMVLPVFTLYASHLPGATPLLLGMAMGVYGLTQALFQIPFGMLSDHVGRKKIIALGLVLFFLGSLLAGNAHTMMGMILGRALQGAGAIGSTVMAMMADLTRENQRTKAMALAGMSIGASFSLAMIAGPVFIIWFNVPQIFWLAAGFSMAALVILFTLVPQPAAVTWHPETEPEPHHFFALLKKSALIRLNAGIFLLHAVFTASFVVIPVSLQDLAGLQSKQQWLLYFPILILAFALIIPLIIMAEKKQRLKEFFLGAIATLGAAEFLLWIFAHRLLISALSLLLFFAAFSLLEAFLPSLVSKTAPPARKGTALGIYSCSQFLGIFVGGASGGWLYGAFGLTSVYLFCMILTLAWAAIASGMRNPHHQKP